MQIALSSSETLNRALEPGSIDSSVLRKRGCRAYTIGGMDTCPSSTASWQGLTRNAADRCRGRARDVCSYEAVRAAGAAIDAAVPAALFLIYLIIAAADRQRCHRRADIEACAPPAHPDDAPMTSRSNTIRFSYSSSIP